MHSKVIAYVLNTAIKDGLIQPDSEGKRGIWIAKIQEHELDINPTKLVKGQGLTKLLTEENCEAMGISLEGLIIDHPTEEVIHVGCISDTLSQFFQLAWYHDIVFYLQNLQCPDQMDRSWARSLKLKAIKYFILDDQLYWKDPRSILLTCITKEQTGEIIDELHKGICRGHQAWRDTMYKILRAGYYWPTLFQEANSQVRACP